MRKLLCTIGWTIQLSTWAHQHQFWVFQLLCPDSCFFKKIHAPQFFEIAVFILPIARFLFVVSIALLFSNYWMAGFDLNVAIDVESSSNGIVHQVWYRFFDLYFCFRNWKLCSLILRFDELISRFSNWIAFIPCKFWSVRYEKR